VHRLHAEVDNTIGVWQLLLLVGIISFLAIVGLALVMAASGMLSR
jgi:hypothetical protein